MLTFPTDTAARVASVVGVSSPITTSLASVGSQAMPEEQAASVICSAFGNFGSDPDQYVKGGQIVGAIFENHASKDEMHARVDASMGWSRNAYSPAHVLEKLREELGVDAD